MGSALKIKIIYNYRFILFLLKLFPWFFFRVVALFSYFFISFVVLV